jgi:catechol 2,3-dioxygenase-like lactoylglutathione lyase family enzyme
VLEHLSMGVSDLERSGRFYDAILAPLGYARVFSNARGIGYGPPGAKDESFALLAVTELKSPGEGWHLAFKAPSARAVAAFHSAALELGAVDEGAPGPRPAYGPTYYASFVRDPDGHRLEAVCIQPIE